jgi:hypothetical protein
MGVPKFPKLGLLQLWGPITLCVDLQLQWGLKQSCSPGWELSNNMLHDKCMQENWVDSLLLMVGSQIGSLTPDLSFGHNLCFRCPNASCEPISDIYVSISFQWYKELFKMIGFDPCNHPLNVWESIGTPTPKMGVHLGVWRFIPSHYFSLLRAQNVTPGLPSWPATLQTLALVASPKLGLWHLRLKIISVKPLPNLLPIMLFQVC